MAKEKEGELFFDDDEAREKYFEDASRRSDRELEKSEKAHEENKMHDALSRQLDRAMEGEPEDSSERDRRRAEVIDELRDPNVEGPEIITTFQVGDEIPVPGLGGSAPEAGWYIIRIDEEHQTANLEQKTPKDRYPSKIVEDASMHTTLSFEQMTDLLLEHAKERISGFRNREER